MAKRKKSSVAKNERYKQENRRMKNKVRRAKRHVKKHPNDRQTLEWVQNTGL